VIDTEFRKSPKATLSFYGRFAFSGWQWVCLPSAHAKNLTTVV